MAIISSILVLANLDEPIIKKITRSHLQAFQQIFKRSKNIGWVTWGRRAERPPENIVLGAGKNVILEIEHVRPQLVDFDIRFAVDIKTTAVKLLRFEGANI